MGFRRLFGVEVSGERLKRAAKKLPRKVVLHQVSPTDRLPFEDGSFDAVVTAAVIEHTVDRRAFIREFGASGQARRLGRGVVGLLQLAGVADAGGVSERPADRPRPVSARLGPRVQAIRLGAAPLRGIPLAGPGVSFPATARGRNPVAGPTSGKTIVALAAAEAAERQPRPFAGAHRRAAGGQRRRARAARAMATGVLGRVVPATAALGRKRLLPQEAITRPSDFISGSTIVAEKWSKAEPQSGTGFFGFPPLRGYLIETAFGPAMAERHKDNPYWAEDIVVAEYLRGPSDPQRAEPVLRLRVRRAADRAAAAAGGAILPGDRPGAGRRCTPRGSGRRRRGCKGSFPMRSPISTPIRCPRASTT